MRSSLKKIIDSAFYTIAIACKRNNMGLSIVHIFNLQKLSSSDKTHKF